MDDSNIREKFLIEEYNRLISEIRIIDNGYITYAKLFLALLSGYFIYVVLGYSEWIKGPMKQAYGVVAILYAFLVLFVATCCLRQYCVSKKHKMRYWKNIDSIRMYFLHSVKTRLNYLLPIGISEKRPKFSQGEYSVALIFLAAALTPLISTPFLINNTLKEIFSLEWGTTISALSGKPSYSVIKDSAFSVTLLLCLPLILTFLCYSFSRYWHCAKALIEAEMISVSGDAFPDIDEDFLKPKLLNTLSIICHMLTIILFVLMCFPYIRNNLPLLPTLFWDYYIGPLLILACLSFGFFCPLVTMKRFWEFRQYIYHKSDPTRHRPCHGFPETFLLVLFIFYLISTAIFWYIRSF